MSRLIDADALKEDLRMGKECDIDCPTDWKTCHYDRVYAKQDFCEWIDDAPTIEPRKKGKWLPDNNSLYEMRFVCSECHESEVVPTIGFTKYKPIWDFCPNCGAEMLTENKG